MDRRQELIEQARRARYLARYLGRDSDKGALLAFAEGCDREREALDAAADDLEGSEE